MPKQDSLQGQFLLPLFELKAAVDAHKITYNKLVKAKTKFNDSKKELVLAQDEFNKTQDAYLLALEKWEVK